MRGLGAQTCRCSMLGEHGGRLTPLTKAPFRSRLNASFR
jgi:hypothetical protein